MTDFRVLVVGRSGQVARELARTVPADGFALSVMGRPELDLTDPELIERAFEEVRPGLIINAAAYTAVDQAETDEAAAFALNADGPGRLAAAAFRAGIPIIHISTDYVFDGTSDRPYTELDPVAPLGVYGRSKLEGERLVASANPSHVILRTAWVYSPFGKNFVKTMLRIASGGDEVRVVHDQIGNPTCAGDIASGIWGIAKVCAADPQAIQPGVFHMTAAGEASWADFAKAIFGFSQARVGPYASVRGITSAEYPTPVRRPADSRLDGSKLEETYGIILPDWRESAERCVAELLETEGWRA
jgi:dTDP-4-dehydrorhamnose reductase